MRILSTIRAWQSRLFPPKTFGQLGERAAERYLKRLGYIIVARGQRGDLGELDLIAVDGRTIVFVEVKTRRTEGGGFPAEAVDLEKQRRMTRLALSYLKRHDLLEYSCRFDVIGITWPLGVKQPTIQHIKAAFEAVGPQGMFT